MDVLLPGTATQVPISTDNSSPQPVQAAPPSDLKNVDDLFPAKEQSVDDLFPADVENQRYRRETLGTSPIQDLMFGDTTVNPIARVLDSFGQGAKQGWGAEPNGLSQETTDFLKQAGIFNDYDKGQRSIIKAANESLFRSAAVGLVDPIMRGLPAAFAGVQAAVAQVGKEASGTPLDTAVKAVNAAPSYLLGSPQVGQGTEVLGREAAAAFEAFPTGLRAPTGIPHGAPHPALAEIEQAKQLNVIGAGEDGYFGEAPTPQVPASGAQTAEAQIVKTENAGMPVDLFEPKPGEAKLAGGDIAPVEPGLPAPDNAPSAPAESAGAIPDAAHPIARDVATKLVAAGRPAGEANAAGQLVASHYEARAERFGGERGSAQDLYAAEGPDIVGADGKPVDSSSAQGQEGAIASAEPELNQTTMREHGIPETAASIASHTSDEAIKAQPDYKAAKSGDNVAATKLVEATVDPATIEQASSRFGKDAIYAPVIAEEASGHNAIPVHLAEYYAKHTGATTTLAEGKPIYQSNRAYHTGARPMERIANSAQFAGDVVPGGKYVLVDDVTVMGSTLAAMADHIQRGGGEVAGVVTLAKASRTGILTPSKAHIADIERRYGNEVRDLFGIEPNALTADEAHYIRNFRDADALRSSVVASEGKRVERLRAKGVGGEELDLNQIKRGAIKVRKNAQNTITLFKDANASTFIHETGHQWLEELMADSEHPKAPADLKADAIAVMDWLGVDKASDIKVSHHEKFARGFERYMMEGKAPNQALAGVFAKFKDWLTRIYQTVTRLKSPINDEIRGVFDRLLTLHPEDVVIEPEGAAKTFADIHEGDAEHTPPEMAHPAAETIQGERDNVAARHAPEDNDARLENTPEQTRRSEAGNQQPASDADATGTDGGETGNAEATGAVGAGGNEAPSEGPRTSAVARTQEPVTAHDKFPDKAGNIRLENINTPEDVLQVLRDSANRNVGFIDERRGVVSDAQALSLAEAMGMDAAFLDTKKIGTAWNKEEIFALEHLLIQSANDVHAAMNGSDVAAYAETKARHLMIHDMVQGKASAARAEAGRSLQAYAALKKMKGSTDAHQLAAFLKDNGGNKTLFQLEQEMKFGSKLQTPQQTAKFVNDTAKGTFRSAILEYYINALISGPFTHTRYAVGNAVGALFTPLVEIPLASAIGKAREIVSGEKIDRVHFGEAGAQLYGLMKGSRDGLSAAIEAYQTGVSPPLPTERISPHFAQANRAIPGRVGEILNIPSKSVAGIHSFFKALRYEQNIQSTAFRTAMNEGLGADAFNARIAELTTNPTEAMMNEAREGALKELYMAPTEYHSFMGSLTRATNSNLAAKIIVPFMKIGSQITRNAFIERTPLGLLTKDIRENVSGARGGTAADLQAGKIAAGLALIGTTVGMTLEGNVTGDGPTDPAQRKVWLLSHKPNTIQIGDLSMSYQGLGSLGMLMRFSANMTETAHAMGDKDMGTLALSYFEGFTTSVLDENFLRGVKDLTQAMYHPKEYGPSYLKSMITNWLPWSVGMSQVARKIDPYSRETHGIFQAAQAKIPYLSEGLMPRRDMFGEPIRNSGPNPDYANDPVVKAMDDLHIGVGKIGKKVRGIDLSEQQYDDLARIAGRMAKMKLNAQVSIISNPNVPPAQRIEMIKTAISSSRETARDLILMQNPALIRQATDAKVAKLRGEPVH